MSLRVIVTLLSLPAPLFAAGLQGSLQTQWQSQYISEGRDNLDGSSLYSVCGDLVMADIAAGVWQAWEAGGDYRENTFYAEYAPYFGEWNPYLNVSYLQFHPQDPDDVEVGIGVSRRLTTLIRLALDSTWSKQASGRFYALSAIAETPLWETVIVDLRLTQTYDDGYASEAYDGLNNLEAGLQLTWNAIEGLSFYAGWQHSWAGEDVRRDGGQDESWGQIGVMGYF